MSALEKEIIEKFRQLAPENQERLLSTLQAEAASSRIHIKEWLEEAKKVRVVLRPDANGHVPTATELVNEAREERNADILHSLGFRRSSGNGTG